MQAERRVDSVAVLAVVAVLLVAAAVAAVACEDFLFPQAMAVNGQKELMLAMADAGANPHDPVAHLNLGYLLLRHGRYEEALQALEEAESLEPEHPAVFYNMGLVLFKLGRLQEAENALVRAYRLSRHPDLVFFALGDLMMHQGRYDEAVVYLEEGLRWLPEAADLHLRLAEALEAVGQGERAREHYASAVLYDPSLLRVVRKKLQ